MPKTKELTQADLEKMYRYLKDTLMPTCDFPRCNRRSKHMVVADPNEHPMLYYFCDQCLGKLKAAS